MTRNSFYPLTALAAVAATAFLGAPAEAGRVTSSIRLPVEGDLFVTNGPVVALDGVVHIVAQVFETSDGLVATLRYNISQLDGAGDDGSSWIGVGADQYPPDPVAPGVAEEMDVPYELMMLTGGYPPDPISPQIFLSLMFDEDGRLLEEASFAEFVAEF